ncbi:MAG: hypothetical protein JKY52_16615 [Flavobacteriales bacterium]|nr:hypothetical protein [Flavobacteriales bacterium]
MKKQLPPRKDTNKKYYRNSCFFIALLLVLSIVGTTNAKTRTTISTGNWNDSTTWDCNCIPASKDDIVIMDAHVITLGDTTFANNLTIDSGGELNNSTNPMTITGDYTVNGMHSGIGLIMLSTKGAVINGVGIIANINGVYIQENASINEEAKLTFLGDLIIIGARTLTNNGEITLKAGLNGTNVRSRWINAANSTLIVHAESILSTGTFVASPSGNKVRYNRAGNQDIKVPAGRSYHTLILATSGSKKLTGSIAIKGNLEIIDKSSLDVSSNTFSFSLAGDWINTSKAAQSFKEGTGKVTFDGPGEQTLINSNGETFYDLVLNKPDGIVHLGPFSDVTVTHRATLKNGIVNSRTNNCTFIFSPDATCVGGGNTAYIDGRVRKLGTAPFTFPVGHSSVDARIALSAPDIGSTFEVQYLDVPEKLEPTDVPVNNTRLSGYWIIDRTEGEDEVTIQLYNDGAAVSEMDQVKSDLVISNYHGVDWTADSQETRLGVSAGCVTFNTMTALGSFTFGAHEEDRNSMPVSVSALEAVPVKGIIELRWATDSTNADAKFVVERSTDGKIFEPIEFGQERGNNNQMLNNASDAQSSSERWSYYRLKQTDSSGSSQYSKVFGVVHTPTEEAEFKILTDMFSEDMVVLNIDCPFSLDLMLDLYNDAGQLIWSKVIPEGIGPIPVNKRRVIDPSTQESLDDFRSIEVNYAASQRLVILRKEKVPLITELDASQ